MKKSFSIIFIFILGFFCSGCGNTAATGELVILGATTENNLSTLSNEVLDLEEVLSSKSWEKIAIDLDQFYATPFSTVLKSYAIDMSFDEGKVTAYADCQKLTAHYKINDKALSFSKITYSPAIDVATCIESQDADQAVHELFSYTFEATKVEDREIILFSDDVEAEITLKR